MHAGKNERQRMLMLKPNLPGNPIWNARPMASRVVALIVVSFVMARIAQVQANEEFVCNFGSDNRTVSVVKTDVAHEPKACRVDYTRNGRTTTLWSSKTGYAYCVAKAASLVTKLAEGHYSCKPRSVGSPDDRT